MGSISPINEQPKLFINLAKHRNNDAINPIINCNFLFSFRRSQRYRDGDMWPRKEVVQKVKLTNQDLNL